MVEWRKHTTPVFLLQLFVLVVLSAMALRDLVENVDDYLHNNRITNTKLVNAEGQYPFMPNLTVYFQWEETTEGNRSYDWPTSDEEPEPSESLYSKNSRDGGRNYLVAKTAGCVGRQDVNALDGVTSPVTGCDDDDLRDQLLNNQSFPADVDLLLDRLRRRLTSDPGTSSPFPVDGLDMNMFALTFDLARQFASLDKFSKPELVYCFGRQDDRWPWKLREVTVLDTIFPTLEELALRDSFPYRLEIRVNTGGMLDVRGFDVCDQNVQSDEQALYLCKIRAMVDLCGCVPFRYRRLLLPRLQQQQQQQQKQQQFCTRRQYESCLMVSNHGRTAAVIRHRCKTAKACLNANTVYSMSQYGRTQLCPNRSLELVVDCYVTTYMVMEEQMLTSWSQLLAQLGGNLGLYLGVSLLSVWKFFTIVMYLCRKRRRRAIVRQRTTSLELAVRSQFQHQFDAFKSTPTTTTTTDNKSPSDRDSSNSNVIYVIRV